MPAQAQAEFTGAGEESELDCDGAAATIEGASNILTITGACTSLTVTGAGNRITVDLAQASRIQVVGADNEIRWRAPGTAKPRLSVTGAGNRISRQR
ncbi:hypothetical protein BXU08_11830 [Sphingomonas sp. LM7]|nr:hypothetical protein BXU08_11830 [Sphingomonas sp. LM7]